MIHLPRPRRDVALWLLVGLAIRESFSFWTGHPFDFEVWIRNAFYVAHGWSPYSYMPPVPGLSVAYPDRVLASIGYLPLWPLILAGLYQLYALWPSGGRFLFYFLIKQPPILGDVLLGALIFVAARRWGAERVTARRLLAFWMVFPYPILISAIWGQFDGLVAALILGSLLSVASWKRSSLMGLGVLLKLLPIIFVPYMFLRAEGRRRWVTFLGVAVPALATAATFVVTGWGLSNVMGTITFQVHGSPQGLTIGSVQWDPALTGFVAANLGWIVFLGYAWIPVVLVGSWWIARRYPEDTPAAVLQGFLFLTVLLFLSRWEVNEQYLIYLLPLLLLDATLWHPERRALFHLTWILGLAFLVLNNFFLVRFAIPVFPSALSYESMLQANTAFYAVRTRLLEFMAVLFSLHLAQVAWVVADPAHTATPWLVLVLRRTWSASVGRVRARASERGG